MLSLLYRPAAGVSAVISTYAAAAQIGAAPGAGSGATQISEEERRRILEEEQHQLDQMKVLWKKKPLTFLKSVRLCFVACVFQRVGMQTNDLLWNLNA